MPVASFIPVGVWLWDKYGKSLTDRAVGAFKSRWEHFTWNDAAEAYRDKIKRLHGTMQIMGMAEAVRLDDIFTDVYMLDKPTAFGRYDIESLKRMSRDPELPPLHAKRINGLRLVRDSSNLFILGKPGAGKTTFLKYLALQAADGNINKIPIVIILRHWADSGLGLMPFILERFETCDFPSAQSFVEELLRSGNAIVLFDGLDEVSQESGQRDKQIRAMQNFIEKYDRTQFLITCRIAASDYSFESFHYVEVADFTEKQIEVFSKNWFRNEQGDKDETTSEGFLREFRRGENKGLRDLARTPLLLTLLCLAFNETLTFPRRRVEIYEEALDALLKKWDSTRRIRRDEVYRKLSLRHKANMLADIAAQTFERNEYFIPQARLEILISAYVKNVPPHNTGRVSDGADILKAIEAQHGIFVERARGVYSFSHLTFQEYFAAKDIVSNTSTGTLPRLVSSHCEDKRWREVFLLIASLLPDATDFVRTLRKAIDQFVASDEKLRALLGWANTKSVLIPKDSWIARRAFLVVELAYSIRNPALQEALVRTDQTNEFDDTASPTVLDLARTLRRMLAIAEDIQHLGAHRLASNPAKYRYLSNHIRDELNRATGRANTLGMNEFAKSISKLSTPKREWGPAEWKEFAVILRQLTIRHIDVGHERNLSKREESRLTKYFQSAALLQDCLEIAVVSPETKMSILNSLYLPSPLSSIKPS